MAILDNFTTVSDGDQLNDGYFNSQLSIPLIVGAGDVIQEDFTTDTADTKANFSYNSTTNRYENTNETNATLEFTSLSSSYPYQKYNICGVMPEIRVFSIYDEMEDASVDTTLWESPKTMTETAGYLEVEELNASGSNEEMLETHNTNTDISNYSSIHFRIERTMNESGSGINSTAARYGLEARLLGSTSGDVKLWEDPADSNTEGTASFIIDVYFISSVAYTFVDGVFNQTADISGLSGTQILRFTGETGTDDTIRLRLYYLRGVTGSETTGVTHSVSFDNGSTYETVTSGLSESSTDGVVLGYKLSTTAVAGEGVEVLGYNLIPGRSTL